MDIQRRAEGFLARVPSYLWDRRSLPVPIEDIVDSHLGLLVRDVQDLSVAPGAPDLSDGQMLSGLLLPARGEIWVSAGEGRDWPARRRFTIAHEAGHWCLHREVERSVFCRSATVGPEAEDLVPAPPNLEHEANAFAAAVLMPPQLIREHYDTGPGYFERLCSLFGVSGAAMGRRLHAVIPRRRGSG